MLLGIINITKVGNTKSAGECGIGWEVRSTAMDSM